jgi:two-component system response regulator CpxR
MRTRTILIADDDRLVRESLHDLLADYGWAVEEAGNGLDAMTLLSRLRCDLLLSDVDMPDMTGFELLSWVATQTHLDPRPPVVLMSARADQRLVQAAQQAGAVTLLPKPVALPAITSLVSQLLDR